ncbi:MAG TPA: hypothetical protein PKO15_10740 [Fibrobacteria bacterium]|nr:hypothetical protein [Fibrobacteria bacterium]
MTTTDIRCRMDIEVLRLAWRPASAGERLVVGTSTREGDTYSFRYDGADLEKAVRLGFQGYPGMSVDHAPVWNGRSMEAFRARLPQSKRPDREHLLGLWGVAPDESDPFVLLGATGGRLVTDAFEFLPVLRPLAGTRFLTPVAGFRYYEGAVSLPGIPAGTAFRPVPEPSNAFDPRAVRLEFQGQLVGYLRKVVSDGALRARESGLELACTLARAATGSGPDDVVVEVRFL